MSYYKKIRKEIFINGNPRELLDLEAEVFSYDEQMSKFVFKLKTNDPAETIDLKDAEVEVLLQFVDVDGSMCYIKEAGQVESDFRSEVSYIVSDHLDGYNGSVAMAMYITLADGSKIDIQNMRFKMRRSWIDGVDEDRISLVYFESFEQIKLTVEAKATEEKQAIENIRESVRDSANDSVSAIEEIKEAILARPDELAEDILAARQIIQEKHIELDPDVLASREAIENKHHELDATVSAEKVEIEARHQELDSSLESAKSEILNRPAELDNAINSASTAITQAETSITGQVQSVMESAITAKAAITAKKESFDEYANDERTEIYQKIDTAKTETATINAEIIKIKDDVSDTKDVVASFLTDILGV